MFDHERAAVARLRRQPGLLLAGAGLLVVLALAYGVALAAVDPIGIRGYALVVGPVPATVVAVLLVPFPLAAVYEVALDVDDEGSSGGSAADSWPLGRMLVTAARTYVKLLTATVSSAVAGLVVGGGLLAALLAAAAGVDYVRYGMGAPQVPSMEAELHATAWLVVAAAVVTQFLLAFYDLSVVAGDRRPVDGWQAALQFAAVRPRSMVRYAVGRLLVLAPGPVVLYLCLVASEGVEPTWLAWQPDWVPPVLFILGFSAGVLAALASLTLAALYHVEVYRQAVEPALSSSSPPSLDGLSTRQTRAAALAAVLVVGAVAGGLALRVEDVRPRPSTADGSPGNDPSAMAATAHDHVRNGSYVVNVRRTRTNGSSSGWREMWNGTLAVDRADRRLVLESSSRYLLPVNWTSTDRVRVFASDGSLAASPTTPRRDPGPGFRLASYHTGGWTVDAWPGYAIWGDIATFGVAVPEGDRWRVLERGDGTVKLSWRNRTPAPANASGSYTRDRRVTMTIDAETGQPVRIVETTTEIGYHDNGSVAGRWTTRERAVYREFDDVDVGRPPAVGGRSPMEWFWEVVYY